MSFDWDAHCLSILKIEVFRKRVNAETCTFTVGGVRREDGEDSERMAVAILD